MDPELELLARIRRRQAQESLSDVQGGAEEAARADRDARLLGVSRIEAQNDPFARIEADGIRRDRALSSAPHASGFLSNPDNAAVAHDQVESLSFMERIAGRFRRAPAMFGGHQRYGNQLGRQAVAGLNDYLARGLEGLGRFGQEWSREVGIGDPVSDFLVDAGGRGRAVSDWLRGDDAARGQIRSFAREAVPLDTPETGFAGDVAGGLGQIGGAVLTAPMALPLMFGGGVSQMDERVQADMAADGRTEMSDADKTALVGGGLVTTVTEKLALDRILKFVPDAVRDRIIGRVTDIATAGLTEGATEVLEGVGQNTLERLLLNPDAGILDGELVYEGGVGATVGAIARSLVLTAMPGRQYAADADRAAMAQENATRFDEMAEAVQANPLLSRAPDRLRQFLESATGGETVYIPGETVATFFQSNPELSEWLDEWDIRDQVEAASVAGTDVAIPLATYLTKVLPQAQADAAFRPDLRLGLDAMSQREAEAFLADGEAQVGEATDAAVREADEADAAAQPVERVYADVFRQLREAGVSVDVARQQAAVEMARARTLASRESALFPDAWAAYQAFPLSIRRSVPEAVTQRMDRLDVMMEALRRGRDTSSQGRMMGASLMEFVSREGGAYDPGGDLQAIGADRWHVGKPGKRRIARADDEGGRYGLDIVAQRAVEAGYLPEGAGPRDLLDAMSEEIAGRPRFSESFERDVQGEENQAAIDDLAETLAMLGLDANTPTAEVRAALDGLASAPDGGVSFDQSAVTDTPAFNRGTFDPADPRILYQERRGQITLRDNARVITLFQRADRSTVLHELGHSYLEQMAAIAGMEGASSQARDDLATVMGWMGVESFDGVGVEQHEQWARAFEAYLMEGRAPSVELRGAFERFRAWLVSIYRTVTALNTPINDDVRGVFDRLLATDGEIEAALADNGFSPASDASVLGMTQEAFSAYAAEVERARSDAEADLLRRTMRAIRRQRLKSWNEEVEALRPEVTATVEAQRDIRAIDWLAESGQAMSRDDAVRILGDSAGLALLPKRVPPIVQANGLHPDTVAEAVGYRSGAEMLNALMEQQAERVSMTERGDKRSVKQARIDNEIERILLERHGDPLEDGSIEEEALSAIHGERFGEVLGIELGVLARRVGQAPPAMNALREWARNHIGARPVSQARPGKYLRAERKAGRAVQEALAKDDRVEAFRQKQAQTVNHLLYSAARKAEEEADAAVNRMSRLGSKRTLPSMDQDYLDRIHDILSDYDLTAQSIRQVERRQSLRAFIEAQQAEGVAVNIPDALVENARRRSYLELTVDELMQLDETIQGLAGLGRLKKKLRVNQEEREFQAVVTEAVTAAEALPDKPIDETASGKTTEFVRGTLRNIAKGDASLRRLQSVWRNLDGGQRGIWTQTMDEGASGAYENLARLQRQFWERIKEAQAAIPTAVTNTWFDKLSDNPVRNPRTGEPLGEFIRRDLVAMALHVGSLSNFEKAGKGWGIVPRNADPQQVADLRLAFIQWLDARLDPTEWDYVQAWWDAYEAQREEYFANERELTGIRPIPVESAPVPLQGRNLRGGYMHITYDARFDAGQAAREAEDAADMFGGFSRAPRTSNGAAQDRTGYIGFVSLDLEKAGAEAVRAMTRIAYGRYITDAVKFLRNPDIRDVIVRKEGEAIYEQAEAWLASQVKERYATDPGATFWVRIMRGARVNFSAAVLLGSFTVLIAQPAGMAASAAAIGPGRLAKGYGLAASMIAGQGPREYFDFITSRSAVMRERLEGGAFDRDIRQSLLTSPSVRASKRARDKASAVRERMIEMTASWIGAMDFFSVSGPTWMAVYDKALADGMDERRAIYAADAAVERSQGGARPQALAGVMRQDEITKMLTFAGGWANAHWNLQRDAYQDFKLGRDRSIAAKSMLWLVVAAPLIDAMLSNDPPWDDFEDDDDGLTRLQKLGGWLLRNIAFGLPVGIPGLRDAASMGEREVRGEFAGELGVTPLGRVLSTAWTAGGDVVDAGRVAAGDDDAEVSRRWPSHIIEALGFGFGVPGTIQASRAAKYSTDVADGEQNPETALDWITGFLRGPQEDQE